METLKKQYLFWDVDLKKMDSQKNKKFIINRILARGDLDDFRWANSCYGKKLIKKTLINSRTLDAKSQNFWQLYFNIDKSKCKQSQSTKKQIAFWKR